MIRNQRSSVDELLSRIKEHKFVAPFVIVSVATIAVAAFVAALGEISSTVRRSFVPIVNPESIIGLKMEPVTDASGLVGVGPESTTPLTPEEARDMKHVSAMLARRDIALANWVPFTLRITNLSASDRVLVDQIALEVTSHTTLRSGLKEVFYSYTGSAPRDYDFYDVELGSKTKEHGILVSKYDQQARTFRKQFYDIAPGTSESIFISLRATEVGEYEIRCRVDFAVNTGKHMKYADEILRLAQLDYAIDLDRGVMISSDSIWQFSIQVGAFRSKDRAEALRATLEQQGYRGRITRENRNASEALFKVSIGCYQTHAAAQADLTTLITLRGLNGFVIKMIASDLGPCGPLVH
jgi:hypothetical protein